MKFICRKTRVLHQQSDHNDREKRLQKKMKEESEGEEDWEKETDEESLEEESEEEQEEGEKGRKSSKRKAPATGGKEAKQLARKRGRKKVNTEGDKEEGEENLDGSGGEEEDSVGEMFVEAAHLATAEQREEEMAPLTRDILRVVGARVHNLKNVSIDVPKKKVVVFTGPSGSGKSSLVFDTIFSEAQRQLFETFSSFARMRLPKMDRPEMDIIHNLSSAIVIDQKRLGRSPSSTVGTVTEIYTFLRLLFARVGEPCYNNSTYFSFNKPEGMCDTCKGVGKTLRMDEDKLIDWDKSINEGALRHHHTQVGGWIHLTMQACRLFPLDKPLKRFTAKEKELLLYSKKISVDAKNPESGVSYKRNWEGVMTGIMRRLMDRGNEDISEKDRAFLSMNPCVDCSGTRLNERARGVKVLGKGISELAAMEVADLYQWFLQADLPPVAKPIITRINERLSTLVSVGVGYVSLDRPVPSLSGGESQRVKMAKQLGCSLVDMIYVLDEPSAGLHPRDVCKVEQMLRRLCDGGNTVLVVEHDSQLIESSDWVVDMGPGAGTQGGKVLFSGTVSDLKQTSTATALQLTRETRYHDVKERRVRKGEWVLEGCRENNLQDITVTLPKGVFVCVVGVSGSGKSSFVHGVFCKRHPEAVVIDQSPIGRTSRGSPVTYTGAFDYIRKEFAKETGEDAGLFSFNSTGACPKCKGQGRCKVEMAFLEDAVVLCDKCRGKRYTRYVLGLRVRGKNIHDVLNMTVDDALGFFSANSNVVRRLEMLSSVGLGYVTLGQSLSTLSGGEAQRLKLASELHKEGCLYVMDEPTTGLHMKDVEVLLGVVDRLVSQGNSVVIVEHNLDVIARADWLIEFGPEGGKAGGRVVAEGTPEHVATCETATGVFLKQVL
eukprot:comp22054_c0_seq1/m.32065 comp22054_c0_seq1/g.32065  ORF comp22054_c0_seq1/g.32065 comp22054_c0_seq1/m.32065 type:complete len:888 (-) comp22054_c0_seq1:10-2673(-)